MKTLTYIAEPGDDRCQWFEAEIPLDITKDALTNRVNLKYFRKGQDLELQVGTLLIYSEANHHRKMRGFTVKLGYVTEEKIEWIKPTIDRKNFIKSEGFQNLMKGSGDIAGVFRMALYIRSFENHYEAFKRLKEN